MQACFLLGPAGSGKTFRCLAEIRAALRRNPGGAPPGRPLLLLAPKQATFQLERQLLAPGEPAGFERLRIYSFDRLARHVLETLKVAPPPLLSEEGRIMVLRALLRRHEGELARFCGSAARAGFAQELGAQLAELQQHGLGPAKLRDLANARETGRELAAKLRDLALLLEKYSDWLARHQLQDAHQLLDFATAALREAARTGDARVAVEALWLDGFAEMTPQELGLLAAMAPFCGRATLAFCLPAEPADDASRLSLWSAIGKTFRQCRAQLAAQPGCETVVETLSAAPETNRFAASPVLASLANQWTQNRPAAAASEPNPALRLVACHNAEAEAVFAARELLRFVRAGHRWRDCAVLVRGLEGYHRPLARVFRRYQIPFFLDRREAVAHHPLAELTRGALRTVAFDWAHEDWFAALKAGFSGVLPELIDELENLALEFGWRGRKWREPLPQEAGEQLRQLVLPPYERLAARLARTGFQPTGGELAEALRAFWNELNVGEKLEAWSLAESAGAAAGAVAVHATVWDQMVAWLENVELAFAQEPLPLRDWLPVLEAGLAHLTVGVIPPALDEVLIGAIDRARNPDLKFALILGVNETVFPAPPPSPVILTTADRDELEKLNARPGPDVFDQICRERYLGYIACTRAEQQLCVTYARQDAAGKALNPSSLVAQLQKLFPTLTPEEFNPASLAVPDAEHACELIAPLVQWQRQLAAAVPPGQSAHWERLLSLPALQSLAETLRELPAAGADEVISPALAARLYGPVLASSVSRLEEFAKCPFQFFIHSGLHAGERKQFELDARERGSFQHEVLKIFHEELAAAGQRWRDLTAAEARQRIGDIAAALTADYRSGLLHETAQTRFQARMLTAPLQDFVATLVDWMRGQYDFDPVQAEFGFGFPDSVAPAWEIDLGGGHRLALRGRIDRIDAHYQDGRALVVVMDYKASQRKLDPLLLEHGIQLQLPAYLAAIRTWSPEILGAQEIVPAGMFYVNLRGQPEGGATRAEVLDDAAALQTAFRHSGRLDTTWLKQFDGRPEVKKGDQFNFRLNKDGRVASNSAEALAAPAFRELLTAVADRLRELGQKIYSGAAAVDPYRQGSLTACEYCDYQAACRINPWIHQWRVLRAAPEADEPE